MDESTDGELVEVARPGDKRAFGQLVERHQAMARRVALAVVGREDIAADLAQEALLQAFLSLDRLRDPERFQSWLYGIVLNICRGYFRELKVAFVSLDTMAGGVLFEAIPFASPDPSPQEAAEAQELHRLVLEAVNSMSPNNRAATLLFYYEQMSLREVAAVLGVSVAAAKGRLHKARVRLRQRLMPLITEVSPAFGQRRKEETMVEVTIADVVRQESEAEEKRALLRQWLVVLLDQKGRRVLPIWIGPGEGQAIAMGLREFEIPRPLTFTFMASLLEAAGTKLEEVRIEELRGDTFYAVAKLRAGDTVRKVDCRPNDAMALALRTGSPIYVADAIMERAGSPIPDDVTDARPSGKGLDSIAREKEEQHTEPHGRPTEEEVAKARQDLWATLFGGED